jgi:hypothetical protein
MAVRIDLLVTPDCPQHPPSADYVIEVAGGDSHRAEDRAALGMHAPGGARNANPAVPTPRRRSR